MARSFETCPYCGGGEGLFDDDHIFPQFLGGKKTIRACKNCNSRFGSTFEGIVSRSLAPFSVTLSRGGIKPARPVLFRRAYQDEHGKWWDINSDGDGWLSVPEVRRGSDGHITAAHFRTQKEADALMRRAIALGKHKYASGSDSKKIGLDKIRFQFRLELGDEIKKLVVKMCIAVVEETGLIKNAQFEVPRMFLQGSSVQNIPVYFDFRNLSIDDLRPPLAHLIYLDTNPRAKRTFGLVQFYGTVQFYCLLGREAATDHQAVAFSLSPGDFRENFMEVRPPPCITPAPKFITPEQRDEGLKKWANKFADQVQVVTGKPITSTIDLAPANQSDSV